jgi:hypothetical protein
VVSVQCSVFSNRKVPFGRARLLPSRHTWQGEAPAEPAYLGGRGSCRAGIPGRARLLPSRASVFSNQSPPFGTDAPDDPRDTAACRRVRLSGSFALPRRVNTRGNAICRCAQDFALIRKNSRCVGHRKRQSLGYPEPERPTPADFLWLFGNLSAKSAAKVEITTSITDSC